MSIEITIQINSEKAEKVKVFWKTTLEKIIRSP